MSSDARLEQLQQDLARLRGPTKPGQDTDDGRGGEADRPSEIPTRGWKDVLWRGWGEVSEQNLFLIAGGVTYALLLALFPGLAAVIVGGTMMGGRGDYLRTCLGALIVTALNFVIAVLNVDSATAQIVFGGLILLTVALYGRERRMRDRV